MNKINVDLIKKLRDKTNAGIADCKNVLEETNGNINAAEDLLRKKGISKAEKKSDRITSQGLVAVKVTEKEGVIIELNCETDFVAKNDKFRKLCNDIIGVSLANKGDRDKILNTELNSKKIEEMIKIETATIGENISFRRSDFVNVENGVVAHYIHNAVSLEERHLGETGVLISLESDGEKDKLKILGKELAMHISAARPLSINIKDLDENIVNRERDIIIEETNNKDQGKPENIIQKIIEGKLNKFFADIVLMEQIFAVDGETKIKDLLKIKSKEIGASEIKIKNFIVYKAGEGIEKKETNFANEVASMMQDNK